MLKLYRLQSRQNKIKASQCPNNDPMCGCTDGDPKLTKKISDCIQTLADSHCPNRDPGCRCWETYTKATNENVIVPSSEPVLPNATSATDVLPPLSDVQFEFYHIKGPPLPDLPPHLDLL